MSLRFCSRGSSKRCRAAALQAWSLTSHTKLEPDQESCGMDFSTGFMKFSTWSIKSEKGVTVGLFGSSCTVEPPLTLTGERKQNFYRINLLSAAPPESPWASCLRSLLMVLVSGHVLCSGLVCPDQPSRTYSSLLDPLSHHPDPLLPPHLSQHPSCSLGSQHHDSLLNPTPSDLRPCSL